MINNFFTIVFRNLLKHKLFTFINVLCLTLGLLCSATIGIYVYEEWKVDRFHTNNDRLYRVITDYTTSNGEARKLSTVGRALPRTIAEEIPEVEKVIPILYANGLSVKHEGQYYFERMLLAGDHFLSSFSFPLKQGDSRTCLREPYSVVITSQTAKKFFQDNDALGKTIVLEDSISFVVTGVLSDMQSSHISFDILISYSTLKAMGEQDEPWFRWDTYCYVLLRKNASMPDAERAISSLSMKHNEREYKNAEYNVGHALEPVNDIYLHSTLGGINTSLGNFKYIVVFSFVGIFILILACINFINLFTALSASRVKEVGIRKTNGASRVGLLKQFLGESLFYSFVSGLIAFGLIPIIMPLVESLTGKTYSDQIIYEFVPFSGFIILLLLTGLLAGWYPALILSKLMPADSLKGKVGSLLTASTFRKSLVVVQFAITSLLLTGTIVVLKQLDFMQSQELGFNKDKMLVVPMGKLPYGEFSNNYESIKNDLLAIASVRTVSATAAFPGVSGWRGQIVKTENMSANESITLEVIPTDYDFIKTMGLKVISGRALSREFSSDLKQGVIINESACNVFGWTPEEAVGKKISTSGMNDGHIVGVIKDYHHHSLKETIQPILSFIAPHAFRFLIVKFDNNATATLSQVEKIWKARFSNYSLEYSFLDDNFKKQYRSEEQAYTLLLTLTFFSFIITCLGLFGMTTFVVRKQTKEIGIRKVLGASAFSVARLISFQFIKLVGLALFVGLVASTLLMNKWLEEFAYRISINVDVLLTSSVIILLIALITVSIQSLKAARMNPVKSLKNE